ncbi:unnamed protein product [Brachionus calyciflorus]|uniref:SSD domain-containing protein n=1 Tax=Brachionus calyciflorus TaxID=104777 RepID=A0A813VK07_9BILA|nr:unnamed protein product [Brachionus calyciflorus]
MNIITDNESLTLARNSENFQNTKTISKIFIEDKNLRCFQQRNLRMAYHLEWIIKLKNDTQNFINQTVLNKFNKLYDDVVNLSIIYANQTLYYTPNLCGKRYGRCAIEGGIFRTESFQKKLLNKLINVARDDKNGFYMDASERDGTIFSYLFGKNRKLKCNKNECYIEWVNLVRNRFDLLDKTDLDKEKALKFMRVFVDYMEQVTNSSEFDLFDISYHASHMLEEEIVKYSHYDFKYVLASFISIWIIYFLFMWFDLRMFKIYFKEQFLLQAANEKLTEHKKSTILSSWFKANLYLIKTSGFLVFATFLQFSFTILSTIGIMSLILVPLNQQLYSLVFVLLIVNCHQSLMFFKNIKILIVKQLNHKFKLENQINVNNKELPIERLEFDLNQVFTETVQSILAPQSFSLISVFSLYLIIGLTNPFDVVKYYCYFLSLGILVNFVGKLMFFGPCIIIFVKNFLRINDNDDIPNQQVTYDNQEKLIETQDSSSEITVIYPSLQSYLINDPKIKILIISIFFLYTTFNTYNFFINSNSDVPLKNLIPNESFMKKFLKSHSEYFKLGPVVIFNFIKPFKYWNENVYFKIQNLLEDAKKINGINPDFELNWIKEAKNDLITLKDIYEECSDLHSLDCFLKSISSPLSLEQNEDDAYFKVNNISYRYHNLKDDFLSLDSFKPNEENFEISSSRVYLTMNKFDGTQEDLNLMKTLKNLAQQKHNFSNEDLIIYSYVFLYLDQIEEVFPSILSIIILSIELMSLTILIFLFNLKLFLIMFLITSSCLVSIVSNLITFGITLNIVSLMHSLFVPVIIFESFLCTNYAFLVEPNNFHYKRISDITSIYFFFISFLGLIFMITCNSYSFQVLFIVLMSTCTNLSIHLFLLYPILLSFIKAKPCEQTRNNVIKSIEFNQQNLDKT